MTSPDDMKTDVAGWTVPIWQEEKRQEDGNINGHCIHITCSLCTYLKKPKCLFDQIFPVSNLN